MYRPYWNSHHSFGSAAQGALPASRRGQLVFTAILLAVYVAAVVVALWLLS